MCEFKVGDKFSSYKEVEEEMERFANATFTSFWKREARTINASKKHLAKSRKIHKELVYYQLMYACNHGGQKFRKKGKNQRQTCTFKEDCKVHVRLKASLDGQSLEVTSVHLKHNHETSKILYAHMPKQRRPDEVVTKNIKEYLDMRGNKKIIQDKIKKETGKFLTLKDLSNIAANGGGPVKEDLESCINILQEKYSADVSLLVDCNSCFKGLYIQTPGMKNVMQSFPEFLAIDATYRLLKIGTPLFLIVAEDGNCQTEIVAVCILVSEEKENFTWFLETFQNKNPNWIKTACIMTDKDLSEREVIRQLFPDVNLIVCVFHTMKIFYREISMQKLEISKEQRNMSLEIIQKIIYSKSNEDYEKYRKLLEETTPPSVYQYFLKNWHECKHEWYLGENYFRNSFLNNTNNRLESINQKLKSVIKKDSSLESFIHSLFTIITAMESERDHKAIYGILKKPVNIFSKGSDEEKYFNLVTREASKHILAEMERSKTTAFTTEDVSPGFHLINGKYKTTIKSCNCTFFNSMLMPCKHIFFLRKHLNEPLFDATLVNYRWFSEYYKKNQRSFCSNNNEPVTTNIRSNNVESTDVGIVNVLPIKTLKTHQQRRKNALLICTEIADLSAQYTGNLYEQRIKLLDNLKSYWSNGVSVVLVPLENAEEDTTIIYEDGAEHNSHKPSSSKAELVQYNGDEINYTEVENNIEVDLNEKEKLESSKPIHVVQTKDENNTQHYNSDEINGNQSIRINDIIAEDTSNNLKKRSPDVSTTVTILQDIKLNNSQINEVPLISNIRMPPNIKKRGRPRGSDLTVIGLPKKRKIRLPQAFITLSDDMRKKKILGWLSYDDDAINKAYHGTLLNNFPLFDDKIPDSLIDENIDIGSVREYFTVETFDQIVEALERKKALNQWICCICSSLIEDDSQSICCDSCLRWVHCRCDTMTKNTMHTKMYFCKICYHC